MIFKAFINPETLEVTFDDPDVVVNHVKNENGLIEIEISKPDPELDYSHGALNPWQQ
jgi:hypothetical protein